MGASLVVRWVRICIAVSETLIQPLVQEDPICQGAMKPVHHNGRAVLCNERHRNDDPVHRNQSIALTCRN